MTLSSELSTAAKARIEKAEINAGIALSKKRDFGVVLSDEVITYVMAVVLAYGTEVCNKTKSEMMHRQHSPIFPRWDLDRARRETRKFLEDFANEAFLEKARQRIQDDAGNIDTGILDQCLNSDEWLTFQEKLLEVAAVQENPPAPRITALAPAPVDTGVPIELTRILDSIGTQSRGLAGVPSFLPASRNPTSIEIEKLMDECDLTQPELAKKLGIPTSTVWRHIEGAMMPGKKIIGEYQQLFSKLLNRKIVISRYATKRN